MLEKKTQTNSTNEFDITQILTSNNQQNRSLVVSLLWEKGERDLSAAQIQSAVSFCQFPETGVFLHQMSDLGLLDPVALKWRSTTTRH